MLKSFLSEIKALQKDVFPDRGKPTVMKSRDLAMKTGNSFILTTYVQVSSLSSFAPVSYQLPFAT